MNAPGRDAGLRLGSGLPAHLCRRRRANAAAAPFCALLDRACGEPVQAVPGQNADGPAETRVTIVPQ